MSMARIATVVGVFHSRAEAQRAVDELRRAGFREDELGVIAREEETASATAADAGTHAEVGAATGAVAGAGVGALWALGIVAIGLPAVGPVIAGGLLASMLASAGGAALAGGILGALVGMGIPDEEARYYEGELQSGRTLVTVRSDSRQSEAWDILRRHGAQERSAAPVQPRTMDVPVSREDVVERPAVSERFGTESEMHGGREAGVPMMGEQVPGTRQPVVGETTSNPGARPTGSMKAPGKGDCCS